jgi:hypothetical protein
MIAVLTASPARLCISGTGQPEISAVRFAAYCEHDAFAVQPAEPIMEITFEPISNDAVAGSVVTTIGVLRDRGVDLNAHAALIGCVQASAAALDTARVLHSGDASRLAALFRMHLAGVQALEALLPSPGQDAFDRLVDEMRSTVQRDSSETDA